MSEPPVPESPTPLAAPEPAATPAPRRSAWRLLGRGLKRVLQLTAILLAVALVATLTVDLGPHVRGVAERAGGNYLKRDFTIGRLSIRLLTGHVIVEDLRIGGLEKTDRPFLDARRIEVALDFSALAHREVLIESVRMSDWTMAVETWPNGRHSFPKFARERKEPPGTEAVRHHGAVGGRRPRRVLLRGSRRAVVDRRTQSRSHRQEDGWLRRHGPLHQRHGGDSAVPADADRHGRRLHYRRPAREVHAAAAPVGRIPLGCDRHGGSVQVAGADVEREVGGRLPAHARDLLRARAVGARRRGPFHRRVPSVQGRPRAEGRLHQRGSAREQPQVSAPRRLAHLGARSVRGHQGLFRLLWRQDAVHLRPETAGRAAGAADRALRRRVRGCRPRHAGHGVRVDRHQAGRPHVGLLAPAMAKRKICRAARRRGAHGRTCRRRRAAGPRDACRRASARRDARAPVGSIQPGPAAARRRACRRRDHVAARAGVDRSVAVVDGDRAHLRELRGTHCLRRALRDPVPRHEHRLAGKRSRACRHHDRLRLADDGGPRRRHRPVRRDHAPGVPAPAHRGPIHRRAADARGTWSGARRPATWSSRTAMSR